MQKKTILFVLNRWHTDFASLANALNQKHEVIIQSNDSRWEVFCSEQNVNFSEFKLPRRSKFNRFNFSFFRLIAGFHEQKQLKRLALSLLNKIHADLVVVPADHKGVFYHLVQAAKCPTLLPQLTLYSEADLLVGYRKANLSYFPPLRHFQKRIFKRYKNKWLQYREPFWYSLGKYMAGFKQQFIPKGGNVSLFAVNGPAFKSMYEAFGINPKNIQVLGSIEQDTLFELNSTYVTDSEPIANFQVNSILFFLPPLFGGEPSEDAVSELFELFSELEEQGHYQIGVKPHPLDTKRGHTHEIEELCRFNSVKVLDSKGYVSPHDLAQLINSYDLCVHGVSSVQFSLFAMEKPTLVYLSEKSPYYHSSYEPFYNQFARFSNSTSSFLQHLKSIRENPKPFLKEVQEKSGAYKSDYMLFDGKSTERYVTACENLMAESQDKRTKVV